MFLVFSQLYFFGLFFPVTLCILFYAFKTLLPVCEVHQSPKGFCGKKKVKNVYPQERIWGDQRFGNGTVAKGNTASGHSEISVLHPSKGTKVLTMKMHWGNSQGPGSGLWRGFHTQNCSLWSSQMRARGAGWSQKLMAGCLEFSDSKTLSGQNLWLPVEGNRLAAHYIFIIFLFVLPFTEV